MADTTTNKTASTSTSSTGTNGTSRSTTRSTPAAHTRSTSSTGSTRTTPAAKAARKTTTARSQRTRATNQTTAAAKAQKTAAKATAAQGRSYAERVLLTSTGVQGIRDEKILIQNEVVVPGKNLLENVNSNTFEIIAEFEIGTATEFGFKVCKGANEETIIGFDVENQTLFIDRTNSGEAAFHEAFAGKHECCLLPENNKITLHVFVDQSSVELFGNNGKSVITDLIFPNQENKQLELYVKHGEIKLHSLELYSLKSTWR
jgi:hypothetical protein